MGRKGVGKTFLSDRTGVGDSDKPLGAKKRRNYGVKRMFMVRALGQGKPNFRQHRRTDELRGKGVPRRKGLNFVRGKGKQK